MNRLSFLKTLGVGVAAAVITPKILANALIPKEVPVEKDNEWCKKWANEIYQRWKEQKPFINDCVMDKDQRQWLVTAMYMGKIELTAFDPHPLPNFIDVNEEVFSEYFIIMGNVFAAGTGGPL